MKRAVEHIKEYLPIYSAILTIIITVTSFVIINGADHEQFRERISTLEETKLERDVQMAEQNVKYAQIMTQLAQIQTDIGWIKQTVR